MEASVMNKIDRGCLPTAAKYVKEQLIGAIIKFVDYGDATAFSDDYGARKLIKEVGPIQMKQALLEHVVKLEAMTGISNIRFVYDYSKDYKHHSIGESELRILETLSKSIDTIVSGDPIKEALNILEKDGVALFNIVSSFVDYRYVKAKASALDTSYLEDEDYKRIIWKIDEYFKKNV